MPATRPTLKHNFTRDEAIDLFNRADLVPFNRAADLIDVRHWKLDRLIDSKALTSLTLSVKTSMPLYPGREIIVAVTGITRASLVSYAKARGTSIPETF